MHKMQILVNKYVESISISLNKIVFENKGVKETIGQTSQMEYQNMVNPNN